MNAGNNLPSPVNAIPSARACSTRRPAMASTPTQGPKGGSKGGSRLATAYVASIHLPPTGDPCPVDPGQRQRDVSAPPGIRTQNLRIKSHRAAGSAHALQSSAGRLSRDFVASQDRPRPLGSGSACPVRDHSVTNSSASESHASAGRSSTDTEGVGR
jgi:hypothetical protein